MKSNNSYQTKSFRMDIKSISDTGLIEGYASIFGNIDAYNDVVETGSFKRTIDHHSNFPLLWDHDPSLPIGLIDYLKEDERGLFIKAQLNLDTQKGKEIFSLIKQGVLKGLSIGYRSIKDVVVKGIRYLKEIALMEVSVVTFPANTLANILSVKDDNQDIFTQLLNELNKQIEYKLELNIPFENSQLINTVISNLQALDSISLDNSNILSNDIPDNAPNETVIDPEINSIIEQLNNLRNLLGANN